MKLKQALKFITKDTSKLHESRQISLLEQRILQDVTQVNQKSMKNQLFANPLAYLKPKTTNIIAFALILITLAGVFGFIRFKTVQTVGKKIENNKMGIIPPVSAEEVISNAEKALKDSAQVYYRIKRTATKYSKQTTPDGGSMGIDDSLVVSHYWYDFKNKLSRTDSVSTNLCSSDGINSFSCDHLSSTIEKIQGSERTIYTFRSNEKTKEGIFVEQVVPFEEIKNKPIADYGINNNENPKILFDRTLQEFKGKENALLETVKENGKEYHKLSIQLPNEEKANYIALTGYILLIEKNTYIPYKEIRLYDGGKGKSEQVFEEVRTQFNNNIFTSTMPPKGYVLMQGGKIVVQGAGLQLKKCSSKFMVDIIPSMAKSCAQEIYGVYDLISYQFKNSDTEVRLRGSASGLFSAEGEKLKGFTYKLYRSKEGFKTFEEAKTADKVEFEELQKTAGGFVEKNLPKMLPYVKIRIDVYDKNTGKKLYEVFTGVDTQGVEEIG